MPNYFILRNGVTVEYICILDTYLFDPNPTTLQEKPVLYVNYHNFSSPNQVFVKLSAQPTNDFKQFATKRVILIHSTFRSTVILMQYNLYFINNVDTKWHFVHWNLFKLVQTQICSSVLISKDRKISKFVMLHHWCCWRLLKIGPICDENLMLVTIQKWIKSKKKVKSESQQILIRLTYS